MVVDKEIAENGGVSRSVCKPEIPASEIKDFFLNWVQPEKKFYKLGFFVKHAAKHAENLGARYKVKFDEIASLFRKQNDYDYFS